MIRQHKYLEALNRVDEKVFGDPINARSKMFAHIKMLIEANPMLRDKLKLPTFNPSTRRLSLNLQNHLAAVPASQSNSAVTSLLQDAVPKPAKFPPNKARQNLKDGKPTIAGESSVKSRSRKLIKANEPSKCRFLRLPDSLVAMRVSKLTYTNSGSAILALYVNAVHKLWKWPENNSNSMGKARANLVPQLWQPRSGILMTNETSGMNPEYAVPCFALSKNDQYLMSASGGKISFYKMGTFKTIKTIMSPPPAATFLALHPQNNNIIAIGRDDSSIQIYDAMVNEVKTELRAHQERITGLAFSKILNVLVSSGADSQLCVLSTDTWEKRTNEYLRSPAGRSGASLADTRVQFHKDQKHLLAVQETQIVIYELPALKRHMKRVLPLQASGSITYATYSCDSKSINVSFECGSISVLSASSLDLRCRINPSLYLPTNPSSQAYPLVIAAHPSKPNQFAVGLTDGGVYVLESEGKWYP